MAFITSAPPYKGANIQATGYKDLLVKLRLFVESEGWTTLRWVVTDEMEWIATSPSTFGRSPVFIGVRTYSSSALDVYNWQIATFSAYVAASTFSTQPAAVLLGIALSSGPMDYWVILNWQRLMGAVCVGGYYQPFYLGKYLPYATPSQLTSTPICTAGTLSSATLTHYTAPIEIYQYTRTNYGIWQVYSSPFQGSRANLVISSPTTSDEYPACYPYGVAGDFLAVSHLGAHNGIHPLIPIVMSGAYLQKGELDGVFWVPWDFAEVGDIILVEGTPHVVIRGILDYTDYTALRLN